VAALYADENFPGPVVAALRAAGHDVLTAYVDGRANLGIGVSYRVFSPVYGASRGAVLGPPFTAGGPRQRD
jgi:hypothetical protein